MQNQEPTRSRRAKVEDNLVFKPKRQSNSVGQLANVSISGAFFVTQDKITIGSEIILYLPVKMAFKKSLCIVSGKIVRVEKQGEVIGYGVCFKENLSLNQRNMLQDFVEFKLTGKVKEKTDPEAHAPRIKLRKKAVPATSPGRKAPERRQHSRVVRDKRLQRTRTARLQLNQRSAKELSAREAMERANHILISLAIAVSLLFGGAFFGWESIRTLSVKSAVGEVLPLAESRIQEGVYFGTLEEVWISTTSDREKAYILSEVAKRLQNKGFEGAIFKDEHGIPIAKIVRNNGTKGLEVRLML